MQPKAPPRLTDRAAVMRNRARAARAPAHFLRERAIADVQEKLIDVNRAFTAPAVITPFAELWAGILPGAVTTPDAATLALVPGAHDLVIHDLCLHWADDPVGQMVQARHALQPDGLFIATLFGGQTLNELRIALAEGESRATGGLSPRIAPMGEIREIGALLSRAGFALPVADRMEFTVTYADMTSLMRDLRAMGEGNALEARLRRPTTRATFAAAAAIYDSHFGKDGRLPATFEIITLTGWAPHPSQQQPLRPGSASHRLADALNAGDFTLPEANPETGKAKP